MRAVDPRRGIHNPIQLGTLANADCDVLGSTTGVRLSCSRAQESDRAADPRSGIKRAPLESPSVIGMSKPASSSNLRLKR